MTELKTLKNLKGFEGSYHDAIGYEEIKELAVKWVKEDIAITRYANEQVKARIELLIERWMKRFNLTEEDLKGGEK